MRIALAAVLALLAAPAPALACGPDTDCVVGERTYRLYVPEAEGPMGAFLFAHGYRGQGANTMRNGSLRALADDLGLAFVALDSAGDDWNLAHRPRNPGQEEAAEYDYVADVLDDLATRIDLDRDRLIATGFSAGGMMTWTLACGMSEPFAGFVPMSGTFWDPVPRTCPTPAPSLVHIHGTEDGVVPLQGRPIGETRQGDVYAALDLMRAHGGFAPAAAGVSAPGEMTCDLSEGAGGATLAFCRFPGGHGFSTARLRWAIAHILGTG